MGLSRALGVGGEAGLGQDERAVLSWPAHMVWEWIARGRGLVLALRQA